MPSMDGAQGAVRDRFPGGGADDGDAPDGIRGAKEVFGRLPANEQTHFRT